jgi:hypothetical protein
MPRNRSEQKSAQPGSYQKFWADERKRRRLNPVTQIKPPKVLYIAVDDLGAHPYNVQVGVHVSRNARDAVRHEKDARKIHAVREPAGRIRALRYVLAIED